MTLLEAVAEALTELGNTAPEKVAALVQKRFGIKIEPKYIPVYRATIQEQRRAEKTRQESRRIAEQARQRSAADC